MSGPKTVLVIGGGGREHALALSFKKDPQVGRVLVSPGNGGTATDAENVSVPLTPDTVAELVQRESVDLVWIGPEAPLAEGLADGLRQRGVTCVGPVQGGAMLEADKAFSKNFMQEFDIPTGRAVTVTDLDTALKELESFEGGEDAPVVIKAAGLAAGKGVVVCQNKAQAREVLKDFLQSGAMGKAGEKVLIEQFLDGEETTVLVFVSGGDYVMMPASQDHKRLGEGDTGPNTGGMGAYAPAPVATPDVLKKAEEKILRPTLAGLKQRGVFYDGVLYLGLMVVAGEPLVIEYNVRFGDPETQVILPMLRTSLYDIAMAMAQGRLGEIKVDFDLSPTATVVLASAGYPGDYAKGKVITGLAQQAAGVTVFHAGTQKQGGEVRTSGGRVLNVTASGPTLREALEKCYARIEQIDFEGKTFRRDIGHRAL